MTKKQKKMLRRILLTAVLFAALKILEAAFPLRGAVQLAAYLLIYAVIGRDVLWRAARNIAHGQVFDENFLMSLATLGAFATGEYPEAVAVMLFYQVGELFQSYAVGKSRKSIAALMDIRPDYANIEADGKLRQVSPDEIAVGDTIVIQAGERIPLDGEILEGESSLDTAALTGESVPRDVAVGDAVISGCINLSGLLRVRTTRVFGDSTVVKILDMVENASEKKAKTENFITKFARYYTPVVVIAAALLAAVPALLLVLLPSGAMPAALAGTVWTDWLHRALIFLVISCPCALVISVPLSFFGGIGGASKCGILVKGASYLETLAKTEIVVFDKTGTLTQGTFRVTAVHAANGFTADELTQYAALAESYSSHPISVSLKAAYGKPIDAARVCAVEEIAGHGVRALVDGKRICVGNSRLMQQIDAAWRPCEIPGTTVHVTVDGSYAGHIVISDEVKPDAAAAIRALQASGVRKTVMLTGDSHAVGEAVAKELGLDDFHADLLPADKVSAVEALLAETSSRGSLAFVGDGINDAPVLARADIGIAMGALGSDAAIEAADIVLMDDQPSKIATAIRISRKTLRIVRQNIVFALGVKALVLVLGAFGMANMWAAVFSDVGVAFIAILNAMRALRVEHLT